MPFTVGGPAVRASQHLDNQDSTIIGHDVLVQSRETGDIVPESTKESGEAKKVKPFAHFLAGG